MHAGHERVPPAEGVFDPIPADFQGALATPPMRLHPATCALGAHGRALGDQRPRRASQDTTPARSGGRRAAPRRLPRQAMGWIISAVCGDVTAPPRRLQGLRLGGCIAHHTPGGLAPLGPPQGQLDRPIPGRWHGHLPPAERLTSRPGEPRHWAATLALALHPTTPVDPTPPVPPQPCPRCHARRVGHPTLGGQDDAATPRPPRRDMIPARGVYVIGHTATGVFQDAPHARHGPAPIDERETHQPGGVPPPGRLQGPRHARRAPLGEGGLAPRPIAGMDGDPCRLAPAGQPTHGARRPRGAAGPSRSPGRETDGARRDAAGYQAGQGLARSTSHPVLRWAAHLHQRRLETRRACHVYPPWQTVVPKRG